LLVVLLTVSLVTGIHAASPVSSPASGTVNVVGTDD